MKLLPHQKQLTWTSFKDYGSRIKGGADDAAASSPFVK